MTHYIYVMFSKFVFAIHKNELLSTDIYSQVNSELILNSAT